MRKLTLYFYQCWLRYLQYVGLDAPTRLEIESASVTASERAPTQYQHQPNEDVAKLYYSYTQQLLSSESNRHDNFERRSLQLLSQTSVLISLLTLLLSTTASSVSLLDVWQRCILILLLLIIACHFVLSIYHASKNLDSQKFKYKKGSSVTIASDSRKNSVVDFVNGIIADDINCIHNHTLLNDIKGSNTIYSNRSFKIAVLTLPPLVIFLVFSIYFRKSNSLEISSGEVTMSKALFSQIERNHITTDSILRESVSLLANAHAEAHHLQIEIDSSLRLIEQIHANKTSNKRHKRRGEQLFSQ